MRSVIVFLAAQTMLATSFGQTVDLSGTVTSGAGGAPLANVNVTLKERTGVVATTGPDGAYHLSSTAVIRLESGMKVFSGCSLNGSILEFGVTGAAPLSLELFSATGSKVTTLIKDNAPAQGNRSLDLAAQRLAPALYFIRYRQGGETTIYRYVPLRSGRGLSLTSGNVSTPSDLSKAQAGVAIDTLLFSLAGYASAQLPISSYTGQDNAVLEPLPAGMKAIPGGTFEMGNTNNTYDWEASPVHKVTVSGFYMDSVSVTQASFKSLTGQNPSHFTGDDSRPVEQVSWLDAVRYCIKKSVAEGLVVCYDTNGWTCDITKNGYRLPTESEWEYACRAGSTTDYFWGDDSSEDTVNKYAWYSLDANGTTHPVAQKTPNKWGLYDMAGNVYQWVYDWNGTYPDTAQVDPTGPCCGIVRVVRGGDWWDGPIYCRSAHRNWDDHSMTSTWDNVGFRTVRR